MKMEFPTVSLYFCECENGPTSVEAHWAHFWARERGGGQIKAHFNIALILAPLSLSLAQKWNIMNLDIRVSRLILLNSEPGREGGPN